MIKKMIKIKKTASIPTVAILRFFSEDVFLSPFLGWWGPGLKMSLKMSEIVVDLGHNVSPDPADGCKFRSGKFL
jgi:hypothetical protein